MRERLSGFVSMSCTGTGSILITASVLPPKKVEIVTGEMLEKDENMLAMRL